MYTEVRYWGWISHPLFPLRQVLLLNSELGNLTKCPKPAWVSSLHLPVTGIIGIYRCFLLVCCCCCFYFVFVFMYMLGIWNLVLKFAADTSCTKSLHFLRCNAYFYLKIRIFLFFQFCGINWSKMPLLVKI